MTALSATIKLVLILGAQILATQGQDQCYGLNSGFDISPGSNDILHQAALSLGECCTLCKQNAACQAFVWVKVTGRCWLKSVTSPRVKDAVVSGLRYSDGTEQCSEVDSGFDIAPNSVHDIENQDGTDLAGCCNLCKQTPCCQAFVWNKTTGQCWLKDVTYPRVKNDAVISGLRASSSVVTPANTCGRDAGDGCGCGCRCC